MAESVELHTLKVFGDGNYLNEIEEYEEIITPNNFDYDLSPKQNKTCKEYDFFVNNNVSGNKKGDKKKKTKKKPNNSNLMDIIQSELALTENISENIITMHDYSKEHSNLFLPKDLFKIKYKMDTETGHRNKDKLNPIFPKILQNMVSDEALIVQYMPAAKFEDFINNYEEICEQGVKLLDIELHDIIFKSHYNISLEQLLIEKLQEIYTAYKEIQNDLTNTLKDIKMTRNTKDNYKEELTNIMSNKGEVKFDPTFRKYMYNFILLKHKYTEYRKKERATLNKIVSLWSDIEMVRLKHNCKTSPYDLELSKKVLDDDEYDSEWSVTFNLEYSDYLDKIEYDYVSKYIEYKEQKYQDKENITTKKKISKPKLNIDVKEIKDKVYELVESLVHKEKVDVKITFDKSVSDKLPRRKKKQNINDNTKNIIIFRIYVDDMFVCETEAHVLEGNHEIQIADCFSVQIMPHNLTLTLKLYENDIKQSVYNIKIPYINKDTMNADDFTVTFVYDCILEPSTKCIGCGYSIKDIARVNGVRLKSSNLFEDHVKTKCDMKVKIGWNTQSSQSDPEAYRTYLELSKKIKQIMTNNEKNVYLREIIETIYSKNCEAEEDLLNALQNISNVKVSPVLEGVFNVHENTLDLARLKLLHLRNIGELGDLGNTLIPINSSQISTEQLTLLQKKDNQLNLDYFIRARHSEMEAIEMQRYVGSKYVQNVNKNILKNISENLMRKSYQDVVSDFQDLSLRNMLKNDSLFTLPTLSNGMKQQWMSKDSKNIYIYAMILKAFNLPDRTAPIISEDNIEHDEEDDIAGFKMKPLRPFIKINYQETCVQSATAIGCHPTWNQALQVKTKTGSPSQLEINIYDEVKVNISDHYVEDDMSIHSKTVHYRFYNKWIGSLHIPLQAVFSMGKLQGTFKINTPTLILGYDNTSKSPENHMPYINRLIKKGTSYLSLQITTSLPHLVGACHNLPIPGDDYVIKHLNTFINSYKINFPLRRLSLTFIDSNGAHKCITQFLQAIPPPDAEVFPKNSKTRTESALSKSSGVSKSSSTKSFESKRNEMERSLTPKSAERDSLYSGYEGRATKKYDELEKTMSCCIRYVSLIPCYEVSEQYNVTLMGLELLKIVHGSPLDHTLLLASYFIYLGIKAWVIVGLGLPRGLSSYVLVKHKSRNNKIYKTTDYVYEKTKSGLFSRSSNDWILYIIDASSGDSFELRDASCPLKTVQYVFDDENIWVNIQSSCQCESISFDFTRSSEWQEVKYRIHEWELRFYSLETHHLMPKHDDALRMSFEGFESEVFDKNVFTMKVSPATDATLYTVAADVDSLRQGIETKIKGKMQKWRSHAKTVWNRYCSSLLREVLPQWEYWTFNPSEPKPGLGQRLKQLTVNYKMFGFPLNFPYTSMKNVIASIKSTCIHINDDPTVEFGLAVEVFSYPNTVLSVWVFLASITRV